MALSSSERQKKYRENLELRRKEEHEKELQALRARYEKELAAKDAIIEKLKDMKDVGRAEKLTWQRGILESLWNVNSGNIIAYVLALTYMTRDDCLRASKVCFDFSAVGENVDIFAHLERFDVFDGEGFPKNADLTRVKPR